jgi:hypothetical protein
MDYFVLPSVSLIVEYQWMGWDVMGCDGSMHVDGFLAALLLLFWILDALSLVPVAVASIL